MNAGLDSRTSLLIWANVQKAKPLTGKTITATTGRSIVVGRHEKSKLIIGEKEERSNQYVHRSIGQSRMAEVAVAEELTTGEERKDIMGALRRMKMNVLDIKNKKGRDRLSIPLRAYKIISSIRIFKKKRPKRTRRTLKNKHICRMMHVNRNPVKILWKARFKAMGPVND